MKGKWEQCTVFDLVQKGAAEIKTGPFGTQLHASDYVEDGIPMINVRNIGHGNIREEKLEFISETTANRLSSHILKPRDIVFGRRAAVDRHAFIRDTRKVWFQGTDCIRLRLTEDSVDARFLSYSFLSDEHKQWMINHTSHGATMAALNQEIVSRIPLLLPPLPIQRRIAAVLSAYDDLIENSTRRIQILEEIAQRLYEEWFVRFSFPGHENVGMVESELGVSPERWEVQSVTRLIEFDPKTAVPREGVKPFVPMSSLAENSMLISNIESREGNSGSKFKNGDTLFARITPCLENGKTGFVDFLPNDEAVAFGSTEYIVLRSKTVTPEFVYLTARSERFRQHAIKSMSGATGRQRVRVDSFNEYLLAQPDKKTLAKFSAVVSPIFKSISCLAKKNANLRRTREMLLPKLISGEIDVSHFPEPVSD